jgi:hypothetical protein
MTHVCNNKTSLEYDTGRVYNLKHFLVQLINNYVLDLIDIHQKHK